MWAANSNFVADISKTIRPNRNLLITEHNSFDATGEVSGSVSCAMIPSVTEITSSFRKSRRSIDFDGDSLSVKQKYAQFFKRRDEAKRKIYGNVMRLGFSMIVFGILTFAIGLGMNNFASGGNRYAVAVIGGQILQILGVAVTVTGVVSIGTVPVDELNLDDVIDNPEYKCRKYVVSAVIILLEVVFGVIVGCLPPYLGFVLLILALILMKSIVFSQDERFNLTIQMAFLIQTALFLMIAFYLQAAISMSMILNQNLLWINFDDDKWTHFENQTRKYRVEFGLYCGALAAVFFVVSVLSGRVFLRSFYKLDNNYRIVNVERTKGDSTRILHAQLYAICGSIGVNYLITGVFNSQIYMAVSEQYSLFYVSYLIQGTVALIPLVILSIVGRKKMFTVLARRFELDIHRLQKDGAFMAELIGASSVTNIGDIRWVQRKSPLDMLDTEALNRNYVNRKYFMRGRIVAVTSTDITVEVLYDEDISLTWQSSYIGVGQVTNNGTFYKDSDNLDKVAVFFDAWASTNFKSDVTVDVDSKKVVIHESVVQQILDQEGLLSWAILNLRCFDFRNFDDVLLLKSPRELGSKDERELVYAKSMPYIATGNKRVDYFISHSWVDNPQKKCQALRSFSETFKKKNGRHPTYWFDKTCIDQSKVNDNDYYALAVLPINIAACNKVLVLLGRKHRNYLIANQLTHFFLIFTGETYMKRLWCLWELFCIFSFCNKELALERVEVELLEQESSSKIFDELANFDLDQAHCFSPIEEYKLRNIIYDISETRFQEFVRAMADILRRKYHSVGN